MCNAPVMPSGARPSEEVESLANKIKPPNALALGQLVIRGQRQLALPSRSQFNSLSGVVIGPPKDISRQAQ